MTANSQLTEALEAAGEIPAVQWYDLKCLIGKSGPATAESSTRCCICDELWQNINNDGSLNTPWSNYELIQLTPHGKSPSTSSWRLVKLVNDSGGQQTYKSLVYDIPDMLVADMNQIQIETMLVDVIYRLIKWASNPTALEFNIRAIDAIIQRHEANKLAELNHWFTRFAR